jgi:hypothetical protein
VFSLRSERVDWRLIEGEIVALDLRRSQYIAINRAGATLWPLLVDGATREQLASRLQAEFGIDGDQAGADVDVFLGDLREQELLETADEPG